MGEGIAGLGLLVCFGSAPWGELVGVDFDVDPFCGFVDVEMWVPGVGLLWDVSYLGDDVIVEFLDLIGYVVGGGFGCL